MRANPYLALGAVFFLFGNLAAWIGSKFVVGLISYVGVGMALLGWAFFAYAVGIRIATAIREKRKQ